MTQIIRLSGAVLVLALMASYGEAGPIPPPPLGAGSIGESIVVSANSTETINIDWMVLDAGAAGLGPAGHFAYLYQIENTSTTTLGSFTIGLPLMTASSISALGAQYAAGDDLDVAPGVGINHPPHVIGGETFESGSIQALTVFGGVQPDPDPKVQYNFGIGFGIPLQPGQSSGTFFFVSSRPPAYGNASILDGNAGPWSTQQTNSAGVAGQRIPVPAPEPGTLLLLGLGLATLGGIRFRTR